jgi:hypothetical protein
MAGTMGNAVFTRHVFMTYNWSGGSILLGQTDSLAHPFFPRQFLDAQLKLSGFGAGYWPRVEQIRLTMGQRHRFLFALEGSKKTKSVVWGPEVDWTGSKGYLPDPLLGLPIVDPATGRTRLVDLGRGNYRFLPALISALNLNLGNVVVYPWLRWEWPHQYYADPVSGEVRSVSYNSADVGLQVAGQFNLVGFTLGVHWGLNSTIVDPSGVASPAGYSQGSNFYALATDLPGYPVYDPLSGERYDHKQVSAFGELRLAGLAMGAGFQEAYREGRYQGAEIYPRHPWTLGVYVNYLFTFGKIEIMPELVWYNYGADQTGKDRGDVIKVGLFTRLSF